MKAIEKIHWINVIMRLAPILTTKGIELLKVKRFDDSGLTFDMLMESGQRVYYKIYPNGWDFFFSFLKKNRQTRWESPSMVAVRIIGDELKSGKDVVEEWGFECFPELK